MTGSAQCSVSLYKKIKYQKLKNMKRPLLPKTVEFAQNS